MSSSWISMERKSLDITTEVLRLHHMYVVYKDFFCHKPLCGFKILADMPWRPLAPDPTKQKAMHAS